MLSASGRSRDNESTRDRYSEQGMWSCKLSVLKTNGKTHGQGNDNDDDDY